MKQSCKVCTLKFILCCLQSGEWTDYDQSLLTRAMIKFPGGTPNRWEKIAVEIGRSVEEVSQVSGVGVGKPSVCNLYEKSTARKYFFVWNFTVKHPCTDN